MVIYLYVRGEGDLGSQNYFSPGTFYWSAFTKLGKWTVIYLYVRGGRGVWGHKAILVLALFIEVPLYYQARKVNGHVFVLWIWIVPWYTIFLLDFLAVPTVWYFVFSILLQYYFPYWYCHLIKSGEGL